MMALIAKFKTYIISGLIMLSLISGLTLMTKLYFEVRAEKAMAVEAFDTYSRNAQIEAIEQNEKMTQLSANYQEARDDEAEQMSVFDGRDLGKILTNMPDWFVLHSADATDKLFSDIEALTRSSSSNNSAASP